MHTSRSATAFGGLLVSMRSPQRLHHDLTGGGVTAISYDSGNSWRGGLRRVTSHCLDGVVLQPRIRSTRFEALNRLPTRAAAAARGAASAC